ncbi:hypothetical protein JST97_37445 [bacterium]|nr:hypothetical protein [bacterium]
MLNMSITVERCKNCGGPLHSRAMACEYCDSLPGPLPQWIIPRQLPRVCVPTLGRYRIGDVHYRVHGRLAPGVFLARRDTPLTQMVLLKIGAREQEWEVLLRLGRDLAGSFLGGLLPEPVQFGLSEKGQQVLVTRWRSEFEAPLKAWSGQVPVHAAIWLTHRLLEQLIDLHSLGFAHGQLRAEHMLIHPYAHGMMLCGWSACAARGPGTDVADGLGAIAGVLRSDVPKQLVRFLKQPVGSARQVNEELKRVSDAVVGPRQFCPFSEIRRSS